MWFMNIFTGAKYEITDEEMINRFKADTKTFKQIKNPLEKKADKEVEKPKPNVSQKDVEIDLDIKPNKSKAETKPKSKGKGK